MSGTNKRTTLDMPGLIAAVLGGEKLLTAGPRFGISPSYAAGLLANRGVAHIWTTAEERRLLAELRAGRVLVVPRDSAPAAARLAAAVETALSAFRSASRLSRSRALANVRLMSVEAAFV